MSVQMLDLPVFNYIRAAIEKAAYNRTVDEFYFHSVSKHFRGRDIETESERLVKSWCNLNELSYYKKYKEETRHFCEFIERTFTHKPMDIIQFIKYIQCLSYNIEPEHFTLTEQQTEDLNLLKKIQVEAMAAYIGSLEQYKNANWSN